MIGVSFTVRTVTARAGGGDIVRTRRIQANVARIGRGADCEIHLPDLAVQLHHATVSIGDGGFISVECARDARLECNGRSVSEAQFRSGDNTILLFGSSKLAFAAGEEPDDIVITISQIAGGGEAADQTRLRQVFTPVLFSIRSAAWILGAAIVLACIAAPIGIFYFGWGAAKIRPDQQWSPGPLSVGHRFLSHNCQACHQQAFVSVRDDACRTCHRPGNAAGRAHADIALRLRALGNPFAPFGAPDHATMVRQTRALMRGQNPVQLINAGFAKLFGHPPLRCAACHTEHVGAMGQVAARGIPARVTRAQLKTFDCISCHREIRERLPDSTVADAPSWNHHPEFRPLIFLSGRAMRARLAGISNEDTGIRFSHWQHLNDPAVIDEAVKTPRYSARLACGNCHVRAADGRSFVPIEMTKDCSACHDLHYAVTANGKALALTHGDPDAAVRDLRAALTSQQLSNPVAMRRRPGYVGDPYRDPISGERILSSSQVDAFIRGTFHQGGLCYGCHTFTHPAGSQALKYRVLPILKMTHRNMGAFNYFPWSAFDHAIPAHHQDSQGRPTCDTCHRDTGSTGASYMTLPLVGECRSCHGASRATKITPASADCMDCHGYHVPDRPLSASFDVLHRLQATKEMRDARVIPMVDQKKAQTR